MISSDPSVHPLCEILPAMPDSEFRMLVEDIKAKGLVRAITLFEGKILDGRHRFAACREAGVSPRFEEYTGNDPAGFVASSCVHRSLTTSQRALIAAGFLAYEQEQARKRQLENLKQGNGSPVQAERPERSYGQARDKAGSRMNVGGRTVERAAHVLRDGSPEMVEKVRKGELSVDRADKMLSSKHLTPPADPAPIAKRSSAQRAADIQALAASGHRREQIATQLCLSEQMVAKVARDHGIEIPLASVRMPRVKARQVIEQSVSSLEACASSLRTIPVCLEGIDAESAAEWAESVTESIKAFTKFRNQLKEHANA